MVAMKSGQLHTGKDVTADACQMRRHYTELQSTCSYLWCWKIFCVGGFACFYLIAELEKLWLFQVWGIMLHHYPVSIRVASYYISWNLKGHRNKINNTSLNALKVYDNLPKITGKNVDYLKKKLLLPNFLFLLEYYWWLLSFNIVGFGMSNIYSMPRINSKLQQFFLRMSSVWYCTLCCHMWSTTGTERDIQVLCSMFWDITSFTPNINCVCTAHG